MKELLDNVSLFWSKYFKDSDILHSLIEGALSAITNLKQDQYSYLLSTGLDSVPLELRKENYFFQLEDAKFLDVTTASGLTFLVYDFGDDFPLRSLPVIMSSPNSETFLEKDEDYLFFFGDSPKINSDLKNELTPTHSYLQFTKDPRIKGSYPNVVFRNESEYIQGEYVLLGVDISPRLAANTEIEILDISSTVLQKCRVVEHDSNGSIYLSISTPLRFSENARYIKELGGATQYEFTGVASFIYPNKVLQVWAPTARIDTKLLSLLYGHIHTAEFTTSTEQYRNFLLGLHSLRTKPFSATNIKSSLCLCANIPVFTTSYEDGDRIIRVDYTTKYTKVYTTLATYNIPTELSLDTRILADAIEISSNGVTQQSRGAAHPQTFFFKELQPLITDIKIKEGTGNETAWWDRGIISRNFIEIPQGVMPKEPLKRRTVINYMYPNKIGEVLVTPTESPGKTYLLPAAAIGDYGITIGQAERNTLAYNLFNDFIKHHTVFIEMSQWFYELPSLVENPRILADVKTTLEGVCVPGTLVILDIDMNASLEDEDLDGIPDIIDPETA